MTDKYIQLNKQDILELEIRDEEGKPTGDTLTFDLEDIELPLRYQQMLEKDKAVTSAMKMEITAIEKEQDVQDEGKLLTRNQERKLKVLNKYFKDEEEILNMFLGENGVKKLLGGRKLGWTSLQEVGEIIDTQIKPLLNVNMEDITKKIKAKYGALAEKNSEVLKDE